MKLLFLTIRPLTAIIAVIGMLVLLAFAQVSSLEANNEEAFFGSGSIEQLGEQVASPQQVLGTISKIKITNNYEVTPAVFANISAVVLILTTIFAVFFASTHSGREEVKIQSRSNREYDRR